MHPVFIKVFTQS